MSRANPAMRARAGYPAIRPRCPHRVCSPPQRAAPPPDNRASAGSPCATPAAPLSGCRRGSISAEDPGTPAVAAACPQGAPTRARPRLAQAAAQGSCRLANRSPGATDRRPRIPAGRTRSAFEMDQQDRDRCRCDPRDARRLAERLGTVQRKLLPHLHRQSAQAGVIDVLGELQVLVVLIARDLLALALDVALILGLDLD